MKIGIYIQQKYAKANYSSESFGVRLFAGVEVVADVLRRSGLEVGYCMSGTVSRFDIILVSITAQCDWFAYIREREKWPRGNYKVIVGGAGVLNVRPFLPWFDVCVWGRAEDVIVDVVNNIDSCHGLGGCVAQSSRFSPCDTYTIRQAGRVYPHEIKIGEHTRKEQSWQETGIGCRRKCKFCAYTWHRAHIDNGESYANDGLDVEFTMLDLDIDSDVWCKSSIRSIGLDGVSERLRMLVNKPISGGLLEKFIYKKAKYGNGEQVKFFCVVGYPTESLDDYREFLETLSRVDDRLNATGKMSILLGCSPFRAMPATPAALWPMPMHDFRAKSISSQLKRPGMPGNVFFQGRSIWAVEWMGTDSLCSVVLDAVALRGIESDADAVGAIARTRRFWAAGSRQKMATLERVFDVNRLMGAFELETYPVSYLSGYVDNRKIMRAFRV